MEKRNRDIYVVDIIAEHTVDNEKQYLACNPKRIPQRAVRSKSQEKCYATTSAKIWEDKNVGEINPLCAQRSQDWEVGKHIFLKNEMFLP